jgi:hypothetical protein
LAVVAAEEVVGGEDVGDAHVGAVVVDLFSGVEGDDAEEHGFGEAGGVLERTGGFHFSLGGVHPIQFVVLVGDARELLRGLAERIVEGLGQEARLVAVGVVEEFAFAADQQRAAFLFQLFVAEFFGLVGLEAAVVPSQLDGGHRAARGEVVEGESGGRIRDAVERSRDGFNAGGKAEVERPHGVVDQVGAHVTDSADAPIGPAALIEGVVDGMVVHVV